MQRKAVLLITTVAVIVLGFGAVLISHTSPKLGLDLRGGLSIVLAPQSKVQHDTISKAKDIIDNRVNALGVAEPSVALQGSNIEIDLPGVKDPKRAEGIIGQTAKLLFRPVLAPLPPFDKSAAEELATTTTTAPGATTTTAGATTTTAWVTGRASARSARIFALPNSSCHSWPTAVAPGTDSRCWPCPMSMAISCSTAKVTTRAAAWQPRCATPSRSKMSSA